MFNGFSNSKGPIKCLTLNNQPCQARPTLVNINSDETLFYPFTVSVNKCGGSCNTIDGPHAYIPNKVKNMNVKVFNLVSRVNETRFTVQQKSCVNWMKVYIIQSKNGIVMNIGVNVKN